jgi:methionine synthase II (cobalamin-independent)
MFATVLGGLPRPPSPGSESLNDDDAVRAVIATQESAGLDLLTDGRIRWSDELGLNGFHGQSALDIGGRFVADWRFASGCTTTPVKQTLPGPFTAGRRLTGASAGDPARRALTRTAAEALNAEALALAAAGCIFIEVEERDATEIGADDSERRLFVDTHRRLTAGLSGAHLSLALTGGNADNAGPETFLDASYASYAVDLIAGPDNWRLVTRLPGDRGVVCGALDARPRSDDTRELLVWAANYAASTGRRGLDRVGLAVVPGLAGQDWPTVERKLTRLGESARLAALQDEELKRTMDPRAVDIRSAGLGRYEPGRMRPGPRRRRGRR